jgi:hypothetical protein
MHIQSHTLSHERPHSHVNSRRILAHTRTSYAFTYARTHAYIQVYIYMNADYFVFSKLYYLFVVKVIKMGVAPKGV